MHSDKLKSIKLNIFLITVGIFLVAIFSKGFCDQKIFKEKIVILNTEFRPQEIINIKNLAKDSLEIKIYEQSNKFTIALKGMKKETVLEVKKNIINYILKNIPVNRQGKISKNTRSSKPKSPAWVFYCSAEQILLKCIYHGLAT